MPASVRMPAEEVRQLSDRDRVEHVLYHARSAGFKSLGDVFLTQLKSIRSRYQEGCTTVCQLLENPVFHSLHLMLHKDRRFVTYMEK